MQKLMVALGAILITGVVGGFSVGGNVAQDAGKERVRIVELEESGDAELRYDELDTVEIIEQDGVYRLLQRQPAPRAEQRRMPGMGGPGQPGTWQITSGGDRTFLLNTATGDSYLLAKGEEGMHWQPIHRPMPEMPQVPRVPGPRMERDFPQTPDLDEKLEALRKELRNAKGEARERIENAIEELELARKRVREGEKRDVQPREKREPQPRDKRDVEPKDKRDSDANDRERAIDELKQKLEHVEQEMADIKERHAESDSVKEREKLEKAAKELAARAEELRKKIKELR